MNMSHGYKEHIILINYDYFETSSTFFEAYEKVLFFQTSWLGKKSMDFFIEVLYNLLKCSFLERKGYFKMHQLLDLDIRILEVVERSSIVIQSLH